MDMCIRARDYHWFGSLLLTRSTPHHHPNRCQLTLYLTQRNNLHWHLNQNRKSRSRQYIWNTVCKMSIILSRHPCVVKPFIQYFARNWPWYSLRGLHIRITWFSSKTNDTALLSVIALTTFNCIVSASVTKGALVCSVVTVHWWRHRTHYDVTEANRVRRNIPTVHLSNGTTRADLRRIPKHCEVTAKAGRQSIYTRVILMRFSLSVGIEDIHIRILFFLLAS